MSHLVTIYGFTRRIQVISANGGFYKNGDFTWKLRALNSPSISSTLKQDGSLRRRKTFYKVLI